MTNKQKCANGGENGDAQGVKVRHDIVLISIPTYLGRTRRHEYDLQSLTMDENYPRAFFAGEPVAGIIRFRCSPYARYYSTNNLVPLGIDRRVGGFPYLENNIPESCDTAGRRPPTSLPTLHLVFLL